MSYIVIRDFLDLTDGKYQYKTGDAYPREGVTPSLSRIAYLASDMTPQMQPLIKEVEATAEEAPAPDLLVTKDGVIEKPKKRTGTRRKATK